MFYTVYKVTNQINGKIYVGKHQTNNLDDWYLGSGKNLKRAIEKHGRPNFKKEILFIFDNEQDMNDKEAELVTAEFVARKDTYNLCIGGQGGFSYINRNNLKVAGFKPGHIMEDVVCAKISETMLNKSLKRSKETRDKLSIAKSGINNPFYGKTHSEKTIFKMKGHTRQQGEKNSQYGKPRSEETKQKIRESLQRRNAHIAQMVEAPVREAVQ